MVPVFVKEMCCDERPEEFVAAHALEGFRSGCSLLTTDQRGTRAWRASEISDSISAGFDPVEECPWIEVWQVHSVEPLVVLDVIKYTGFYTAGSMDLFDEFSLIAQPLMERFGGHVTRSCGGGAEIQFSTPPTAPEWQEIGAAISDFNRRHFGSAQTKSQVLRSAKETLSIWFGHG